MGYKSIVLRDVLRLWWYVILVMEWGIYGMLIIWMGMGGVLLLFIILIRGGVRKMGVS